MAEEDENKTTFFTEERVYCYQKVPFCLKNTGATYQRLIDMVFNDQIGRNLEAYVDDMVIKSTSKKDMLTDLKETFQRKQKRSFIHWKGRRIGSYLLRKQSPIGSRALLPRTRKTQASIGTRSEKATKIFSGTYSTTPQDNRKEVGRKTKTKPEETKPSCDWKLYTDGASSFDGSGARLMLVDPEEVLVEVLARRSIEEKEVLQVETKEEESWMTPIYEYLLSGLLPKDSNKSRKIKIKAPQYKLIRGSLYKKSFYTSCLHYIATPKTNDVIKEIQEGSCGFNTEPRSMVVSIIKQRYYWPSMHRDIARIIQDCEKCKEKYAVKKRVEIRAIVSRNAWPFNH
ncbi:reverse transcriptase domain-containing protein [Tanacetum coccineum]